MSLSKHSVLSDSQSSLSTTDTIDDIVQIKVKVDRKVLDTMINGGNNTLESAEDFFIRVANESGAAIVFPRKGKLQRFGPRDPEVRLFGSDEQVQAAKRSILEAIGPYRGRVTLKLDISYGDHSHIIGKGGKRIQSIMNSTETHIHFPDCNRNELEMKSNQVTITGNSLRKAEEARQMIRQHLPLTISFNVEVNSGNIDHLNPSHPNLMFYQKRYGVIISFKVPDPNALDSRLVTVMVRGTRLSFDDLREAVRSVYIDLTWSSVGWNALVCTITMDIAQQHHPYVMGRGNSHVKAINEHTGAVVSFPEFSVSPINQENSTVIIRGRGIDSAYLAWLELLGYLPLTMIFGLGPEQELDSRLLQTLMTDQLSIVIRQKFETGSKLIVIKTEERNSLLLFEVRRRILGINEEIPSLLQMPSTKSTKDWFSLSNSAFNYLNYETEVLRAFRMDENNF